MSVIGSNVLAGASGQGGGYNLTNSLRFRSSANAYLSRTGSTATNAKLATYSFWFKRGALTTGQWIFTGGASGATTLIGFNGSSDALSVLLTDVSGEGNITTAVFRDPSAWYHFVIAIDTTQATTADRAKIYVNGVLQTVTVSNGGIGPNANWGFNTANTLNIGRYTGGSSYTDGYLAETNFIDGLALTPSSFGETSTSTGVWIPKKYTGTYGTNGFYLPFTDNSALTTSSNAGLGKDFSGNSNYWTTNNISITSGSTYDSMTDVPTLTSATAANYATFNPLAKGSNTTLSDGNLKYSSNASSGVNGIVSMYITTGMKTYFEITCGAAATYRNIQIGDAYYVGDSGSISGGTGGTGTFATWTTGDVVRFACDYNAGTIACYKNNTLQTTLTGVTNTSPWIINPGQAVGLGEYTANFGQQPFAYSVPTGFSGLNTFNLPTPTIGATASTQANKYFDVSIYTGTGALTQSVTNSNSMQPDFVWVKDRSQSTRHVLTDSVRGSGISLYSNTTDSEGTNDSTGYLSAFNSNGFTLNRGSGGLGERVNYNGDAYVGWQWRASNAAGVTNTAGTITSTVSANTSAGFSIVTYTGVGGSGTTTVGHGLGVSPSMVIIKRRNSTADWATYHTGLTSTSYYLFLNSTAGQANYGSTFISPSSSTLTIDAGSSLLNTSTGTYVAYCFAPVAGYSAFGSYTGNGSSDGTFVYLGFRPRFVMIKSTVETSNWFLYDTARNTYNAIDTTLFPSASNADYVDSTYAIDVLSNGFKIRGTGQYGGYNNNGNAYVYACFAESPFKYANAR